MGHITVTASTMSKAQRLMQPMIDYADREKSKVSSTSAIEQEYSVAIVMGSDSDRPVLQPGIDILEHFNIPYTTRVTSAHRTPAWMAEYASSAKDKGIKCIIAAAGGAAHLPGMCAAYTRLPVIGVPIKPTMGDGMDSLLSIANMPRGVPVATVGLNNSTNAALLAARILGVTDDEVDELYEAYILNTEQEVMEKDRKMKERADVAQAERKSSAKK